MLAHLNVSTGRALGNINWDYCSDVNALLAHYVSIPSQQSPRELRFSGFLRGSEAHNQTLDVSD